MKAECLLFVTASQADNKTINRFLMSFRDWEFGSGDSATLVTTRNAYEIGDEETVPPVPADLVNGWAGASIEDVEGFVLDADEAEEAFSLFLVLDDKGVQDQTVIMAHRHYDDDEDQTTKDFDKARVPWTSAYVMWCNLDIANADWEDYCEQDEDEAGSQWYRFVEGSADTGEEDKIAADRAAGIRKLEEEGMV